MPNIPVQSNSLGASGSITPGRRCRLIGIAIEGTGSILSWDAGGLLIIAQIVGNNALFIPVNLPVATPTTTFYFATGGGSVTLLFSG